MGDFRDKFDNIPPVLNLSGREFPRFPFLSDESPQRTRKREEADLRDKLAAYLHRRGLRTVKEGRVFGGYIDLTVVEGGQAVALIETKVVEPMKGIGQLFGYRSGVKGSPTMVLAVPLELEGVTDLLISACQEADIELWMVEGDGTPIRMLRSENPAYPCGVVVKKDLN